MKVQKHAISLACLAALGFAGSAQAVQVAGELLEVYGNYYPQYQTTNYGDASGITTGSMPNGSTAPTATSKTAINWVNSYTGFKGQKGFGDVRIGFDIQAVTMSASADQNSTTAAAAFSAARDAYLFISHKSAGTLQVGQQDTIYKEWGDRVRLLGTSSSNITSSSGLASGVTWAGLTGSTTTFNTRINGQLRWVSPNWNGVEVGVSYRPDPTKTTTTDASLTSMGVRWSNATYYVALLNETHNDFRPFSGTVAATTLTQGGSPRSKDTVNRVTVGYTASNFRLGADYSVLSYSEEATTTKLTDYKTTAYLISGEYDVSPQVTLGANYVKGNAGTCTFANGAACNTDGYGGSLTSVGAKYNFDKNTGVYVIYAKNSVGNTAVLASGNVGGDVSSYAIGLHVKF